MLDELKKETTVLTVQSGYFSRLGTKYFRKKYITISLMTKKRDYDVII